MRKSQLPTLTNYSLPCYKGEGTPIVVVNQDWTDTFTCMVCCNMLVALAVIMLKRTVRGEGMFPAIYVFIAVWNATYFITQFLNPGLVLNDPQQHSTLVERCSDCNAQMHPNQRHCDICRICVMNQDHHCGWFGRCIGRYNILPFYAFMLAGLGLMFCLVTTALVGIE